MDFQAAHVDSFQTFYITLHDDMFQPMQFTMYSNILFTQTENVCNRRVFKDYNYRYYFSTIITHCMEKTIYKGWASHNFQFKVQSKDCSYLSGSLIAGNKSF